MPKKTKKNNKSTSKTQSIIQKMHEKVPDDQIKKIISYMPQPPPRKGSIVKIAVDRVGYQSMEKGRLGKIVDKNDETKQLVLRLFYNGEDRVLSYSHIKPRGNTKEKPNTSYWNPDRPIANYDKAKLRTPTPQRKNTTIKKSKSRSRSR